MDTKEPHDREATTSAPFPFALGTGRNIGSSDDYTRYRHTKAYLRHCADLHPDTLKQQAFAVGYRNVCKFRSHRDGWYGLKRPIPRKYFQVINVNPEVLDACLDVDIKEFHTALRYCGNPTILTIKPMAGVYIDRAVPSGTTLDAILIVQELADAHPGIEFSLVWPEIKVVRIVACKEPKTILFEPTMYVRGGFVCFAYGGHDYARMTLGG